MMIPWKGGRAWIIAEIGVNHEGSMDTAKDLIVKAANAGADAVKFQTYSAENYVSVVQPERLERVRKFQLSRSDFCVLAELAKDSNVEFFSTPLDADDVDFLSEIAPILKISSGDITYLDLIERAAATHKPIILSTGLATREEIARAISSVLKMNPSAASDGSLMLMHCVASYPTPDAEAQLRNIFWLKDEFGLPVGYSDHTLGIKACELAIAAGAAAIEKHFTYRKEDQAFHDHRLSADPEDMKALVASVRQAELMMGSYERVRGQTETTFIGHLRRSVAVRQDLSAGSVLQRDLLICLRPGWGIAPEHMESALGRRLVRSLKAGEIVRTEDLEE